jgi:hypothetical protein
MGSYCQLLPIKTAISRYLTFVLVSIRKPRNWLFYDSKLRLEGVGRPGLEPGTNALKGRCSTD